MDKTALIIAYYFPPMGLSGVQRTLKFVKYLPQYGWKPLVLTATPKNYYAFDETLLEDIDSEHTQIFRTQADGSGLKTGKKGKTQTFPSYCVQRIGRAFLQTLFLPDRQIVWKRSAMALGEQILKTHDVGAIFATAPPFTDFLIARQLAKQFKKPFVIDYRDSWVDNPFSFYPTPFHKDHNIKLESEILTHASKAIVTTRYIKELLLKRYRFLNHSDVTIIPHGFDPEDFEKIGEVEKDPKKFVIAHSGLFQDDRSPKVFFKALANYMKKNTVSRVHIQARFVGIMRKEHLKLIKKYDLEKNVVCSGYLNHTDAVRSLMESDVLWMTVNDKVRSPGKLYEYFGARKPLLVCAPEGIIRQTAAESKAAICVDPNDEAGIENAIDAYYKQWENGELPAPSEEFVQKYDRRDITGDLSRELSLATEI